MWSNDLKWASHVLFESDDTMECYIKCLLFFWILFYPIFFGKIKDFSKNLINKHNIFENPPKHKENLMQLIAACGLSLFSCSLSLREEEIFTWAVPVQSSYILFRNGASNFHRVALISASALAPIGNLKFSKDLNFVNFLKTILVCFFFC